MGQFTKRFISVIAAFAFVAGTAYAGEKNISFENEPKSYVASNFDYGEMDNQAENQIVAPITPVGLIKVTASALNVRETPNGTIKGSVKKDDICYFYGYSGNWLQVLYNGQYGFVFSKYTDIYDFTYNKISISEVKGTFGTNEALASKELSDEDIKTLAALEEIHRNEIGAVIGTKQAENITETQNQEENTLSTQSQEELLAIQAADAQMQQLAQQAADIQAQLLAQQAAEAQAAIAAQQEAEAQAQLLAQQAAEAQAEILAQQQAAIQAALEAQLQAEANKQALLSRDPNSLSTTELCQYVLYQIITPDMDDFAKARAINNWLCNHMTYDLSYYTTRDAILLGRGRCQGYANAYKNLMNAAGIPTDYISGYGEGGRHGWNRVLINGAYYYVDVTWNDSTGNYSKYLLLSEGEMNRDHYPEKINPKTE